MKIREIKTTTTFYIVTDAKTGAVLVVANKNELDVIKTPDRDLTLEEIIAFELSDYNGLKGRQS